VTAKHVSDAARAGDTRCQELLTHAFYYLGVGIANLINLLAPEVIIIGGGVTKADDLMRLPMMKALEKHIFPSIASPQMTFTLLGDNVTLLGAAALVEQEVQ